MIRPQSPELDQFWHCQVTKCRLATVQTRWCSTKTRRLCVSGGLGFSGDSDWRVIEGNDRLTQRSVLFGRAVKSVVISCSSRAPQLPAGSVWVEGQGRSHSQICESSRHWIINLSDPCILTAGEERANDEDGLCRSADLASKHRNAFKRSLVRTQKSDLPLPQSNTRPCVSACEAYFCSGPISTSTLSSGHHTIKMDGVELSRRNLLMLFSFPSIPQLVSLTLHVSCLRNSPSVVEACCWERKETFGPCFSSACALICLSQPFSGLLQWIGEERGRGRH